MKIICIGRNYTAHAQELKNEIPAEPVIFIKPDTALIKDDQPFYLPPHSSEIHHEVEIVFRIDKSGKCIEEKFAHRYYTQFTVGIDFTARDIQQRNKEKGLPWETAKSFDGSAPMGRFLPVPADGPGGISFSLMVNGVLKQAGNTANMLFNIDKIISYVSRIITLKTGDLIYTGTPEGVGKVGPGDLLEAYVGNECLLRTLVK